MPPLPVGLGPETRQIQVPIHCELPRLSETRCESWKPPPLTQKPQPVSIKTRPVSNRRRAFVLSCCYRTVYDKPPQLSHASHGTRYATRLHSIAPKPSQTLEIT